MRGLSCLTPVIVIRSLQHLHKFVPHPKAHGMEIIMLSLENVTKEFRNNKQTVSALSGISLSVAQGDMISIMGPSGSGKSTLMNILGCLDIPTNGTYIIDSKNINQLSDKERAGMRNKKFGFVLQHFALIEDETVIENVSTPLLFGDTGLLHLTGKIRYYLWNL